ncbi:MAG TPA: ParA family protein [Cyclobacteriaceae bacterium]|nr:ParA family protein [Cyclobacteriaceae bacterium]
MPKVITVINMKGGVGKTTLAVNISYLLSALYKKKVLVVDIDPQFNATQYLVEQPKILDHFKNKKTIYDILIPSKEDDISLSSKRQSVKPKPSVLDDFIIPARKFSHSQLDLIPSSLKLINFETNKRGTENLLSKFIEEKCTQYDYVIIDCPPTLSLLTLSAYLASQYYLIPIKPDYLSSLGLPLLDRGLSEYEETHGHKLKLLGIVFTMVNHQANVSKEIMKEIQDSGWDCFKHSSSHSTMVAQSVKSLQDFYNYAKFARYASEFREITKELLTKL